MIRFSALWDIGGPPGSKHHDIKPSLVAHWPGSDKIYAFWVNIVCVMNQTLWDIDVFSNFAELKNSLSSNRVYIG